MNQLFALETYCEQIGCPIRINEPMCKHTTFQIGGPADLWMRPLDTEMAAMVCRRARELEIPLTFLGKGSNLLVSDEGIRGAVLSFTEQAKPVLSNGTEVFCPAGTSLTALCLFTQQNGLSGLEFAYGIPGSVGGAIFMNAGAYGGEISQVLTSACYLDESSVLRTRQLEELQLTYRKSWFSTHPECLITGGWFHLTPDEPKQIRERMDGFMKQRQAKQPLEYPSAGSTFKRPEGAYAAQLIDQCGLKGRRVGGAMVSEKHAGFLINYEKATCADMCQLIEVVRQEVFEKTGYYLECEIKRL